MPSAVTLQLCLLVGVSHWVSATPLPKYALWAELGQRPTKGPLPEGSEPVPTLIPPSSPAVATDMVSNPTNSWSLSTQGLRSGTDSFTGHHGGNEAVLVPVKASVIPLQWVTQDMDQRHIEAESYSPALATNQRPVSSSSMYSADLVTASPLLALTPTEVYSTAPRTTNSPKTGSAVIKAPEEGQEARKRGGALEHGPGCKLPRLKLPAIEKNEKGPEEVLTKPPVALLHEAFWGQSGIAMDTELSDPPGVAKPSNRHPSSYLVAGHSVGESIPRETSHSPKPPHMVCLSAQDAVAASGTSLTAMPTLPAGDTVAGPQGGSVLQDREGSLLPKDIPLEQEKVTTITVTMLASEAKELTAAADLPFSTSTTTKTPPPILPEGPSAPWQISGTEISDTVSLSLLPPLTAPPPGPLLDYGSLESEEAGMIKSPVGATETSTGGSEMASTTLEPILTTPTPTNSLFLPRSKSGVSKLESEEEHDEEDEEDEDIEESEEEDSPEDLAETPTPTPVPHTYSHIPYHLYSSSIWVQRHQGLGESAWLSTVSYSQAGYVSGMLAPVGIGIAGALFILGALYSIKVMHRKRRGSFKHQRRKQRETNGRQDRVMLLADSSEDEF
ncbi:hypothetical protein GN956_G23094 [Arapaima gigas]